MSCDECDKMGDEGEVYYYRWKHANIGIIACIEHFMEIREVLNKAQADPQEKETQ